MTNGVVDCYRCHTPVPENSRYCSSCGADVSGAGGPPTTSNIELLQERLQRLIEGRYRIERLLGKGGMGAVFLAHDLTLERDVAIKVLPPDVAQDDQIVRRFQQEAKTSAKLDHPNIMFDHDGRAMLTDFGISKALQAATGFTATGMIIGTPHYMAPEQAKGQTVDGRADEYSLGVVGYRMITGELPFAGDSVHTILYKHIFEEAPRAASRRANVPEFLSATISRAMSREPDHRYATMADFATPV